MSRRLRNLWPFLAGGVAAFALLAFGGRDEPAHAHLEVLAALGLAVAGLALAVVAPWERLPPWVGALPFGAAFAVIGLLRDAEGGAESGYGPLVLLPVFWLALHGTRTNLLCSFLGVAGVFVVPLLADPSAYPPAEEARRTIVWLVITPIVGLVTHDLVVRIRATAHEDPLTGLPNRRECEERLAMAFRQAERNALPVSVALFDLDGFKSYNDTHGHAAGDQLLIRAAATWRRELRLVDFISRIGGDEFAVMLPDTPLGIASLVVERVRAATPEIRCSVGVAEWDRRESGEQLLARADEKLYLDKAGPRGA